MDIKKLLPPKDAADRMGLKHRTLEHWRWRGKGPDFIRIGGRVMYDPEALQRWLDKNTVRPTAV